MLGAVVAVREGCLWSHIQLVTGRPVSETYEDWLLSVLVRGRPKLCTSGFSFWAVECQRGHGLFSSRKTVSEAGADRQSTCVVKLASPSGRLPAHAEAAWEERGGLHHANTSLILNGEVADQLAVSSPLLFEVVTFWLAPPHLRGALGEYGNPRNFSQAKWRCRTDGR